MAIRTNYTVTDEVEDGFSDVTVSLSYDAEQDADILTIHQNGSEVIVTRDMASEVIEAVNRLLKAPA